KALCRSYMLPAFADPAADAEDMVTETFIRALHCLDRYEDRSAEGIGCRAWLTEIARRICLKHLARHRWRRQWHVSPVEAEQLLESERTAQRIEHDSEEREVLRIA